MSHETTANRRAAFFHGRDETRIILEQGVDGFFDYLLCFWGLRVSAPLHEAVGLFTRSESRNPRKVTPLAGWPYEEI